MIHDSSRTAMIKYILPNIRMVNKLDKSFNIAMIAFVINIVLWIVFAFVYAGYKYGYEFVVLMVLLMFVGIMLPTNKR